MSVLPSPEEVRRRIFLVLLPLAAVVSLALGVHGLLTGRVVSWAAWSGIAIGVLLAGFAVAFALVREGSRRIEIALVGASGIAMAGVLVYGAIGLDESHGTAELIRQGLWLPVLYGVGFLVLPPRVGSIAAWALWMVQALASSSHLLDPRGHTTAETTTLAETLIANAVLILVLSGVARVIRATERRAAGLEIVANTDTLTRIANRRSGERRLEDEVERSIRYDRPLSVVLFDLDLFKRVNDTFGHDVGDQVLIDLTDIVEQQSRKSDRFYRLGGEEFVLLLNQTDREGAETALGKLMALLRENLRSPTGPVTVSIGVAMHRPDETWSQWLARADQAMYRAKSEGKDRVVFAD
jgi:diguanylate cyclase (GGDEF)-like protein